MKNQAVYFFVILTAFMNFTGCDNWDRSIDRASYFNFNVGDTLVYHSSTSNDTFRIDNIHDWWMDIDKIPNELLDIHVSEIDSNCKQYCDGMRIQFSYYSGSFDFRGMHYGMDHHHIINYVIGNHLIKNVFESDSNRKHNLKDAKKVYFTLLYGIIAYELYTGGIFELDEKWFER